MLTLGYRKNVTYFHEFWHSNIEVAYRCLRRHTTMHLGFAHERQTAARFLRLIPHAHEERQTVLVEGEEVDVELVARLLDRRQVAGHLDEHRLAVEHLNDGGKRIEDS